MLELFQKPIGYFLLIMGVILVTPILTKRLKLPGMIGIIIGGMLIGPYGLGIIKTGDRIEFLAALGLVYLMFSVGLEVDIHRFIKVRNRAAVFGFLTFIFPQLMGMGLGWLLHLDFLGIILLGSAFASHTLIAFPIITGFKAAGNETIAVTAGATVFTDICAFIILAVVLAAKSDGIRLNYFFQLFVLLIIFTITVIWGFQRLGKFLFKRLRSPVVEFQIVIVMLFFAAVFAEAIGVHEVVGAFLAGLAINAALPKNSLSIKHVLFIGESFFIPIFLLYSGMIINPLLFFQNSQTLVVALGVTAVAYVSKFIAVWITGKIYGYTRSEIWTVYGLTHAQAAVTIPTIVLGLKIGLFDTVIFNATMLMILLTSITSPLIVQRFGKDLQKNPKK